MVRLRLALLGVGRAIDAFEHELDERDAPTVAVVGLDFDLDHRIGRSVRWIR